MSTAACSCCLHYAALEYTHNAHIDAVTDTHARTHTRPEMETYWKWNSENGIDWKTLPLRTTHFVTLNSELRFTISRKATVPETHTHTNIGTHHTHTHTHIRAAHKRQPEIVAVSSKTIFKHGHDAHDVCACVRVRAGQRMAIVRARVCVSVEKHLSRAVLSTERNNVSVADRHFYVAIAQWASKRERGRERGRVGERKQQNMLSEHINCFCWLSAF